MDQKFITGTPDVTLAYDSKELWGIFQHNKKNTLDYGWIRNRLLRANAKITNDRQNAALDHLEQKGLIEKVSHGRWRYVRADANGRPSAQVVASAPITPELAAQVVPRFKGAMTDSVYAALRENNKPMTTAELAEFLGIEGNQKETQNMSSSLQTLNNLGWLDINRQMPRRLKYSARTINKHGDNTRGALKHNLAPVNPPVEAARAAAPAASSTSAGPTGNGQASGISGLKIATLSVEKIRRLADLMEERTMLNSELEPRMRRLQEISLELAEYE